MKMTVSFRSCPCLLASLEEAGPGQVRDLGWGFG